ncbi:MAG: hypothetical protein JXB88_16845 [Spirochaetales bacterium]|nr:hypothetical protein [Spirochaetales bacterium]
MTIRGTTWSSGQSLQAIPRYARNNRGGRSIVWVREQEGSDSLFHKHRER